MIRAFAQTLAFLGALFCLYAEVDRRDAAHIEEVNLAHAEREQRLDKADQMLGLQLAEWRSK